MADVKLKGIITEETPGEGIYFLITEGVHKETEVYLPRGMVAIVETGDGQEITLPGWLAEEKGLW